MTFKLLKISLIIIILLPIELHAQNGESSLQLVDEKTGDPVVSAYFNYGDQAGVSETDGRITLRFVEHQVLYLSHLSYGSIVFQANEVEAAIISGTLPIDEQVRHLQPVTVLSTRSALAESEVVPVDIRDKVSHDAGAILDQIPGISTIRKSGNYGFDPVLRGFKYDQLNIVIDGLQSANAACPNRMDPATSQIPVNMIDRVEVLKGPHSLRYGNSFGGTINFISGNPNFGAFTPYGRLTGSYEQNGNLKRTEGLFGLRDKNYNLGIFGSWSQGNDYQDGDGNKIPSRLLRGSFGTTLGLKLSENQRLNLNATRNLARDVDFPALPMDLRSDDTWLLKAEHKIMLQRGPLNEWNSSIYLTLVDHMMDNLDKPLNPRMLNAETAAKTRTMGGRTEATFRWQGSWLFAGIDFRREAAEGVRKREFIMGPNQGKTIEDNVWQNGYISRAGMFGEYHLNLDRSHFTFSGRIEVNEADLQDKSVEFSDRYDNVSQLQINPALSVGWRQQLNEKLNLALWLGRSQRSAGLTERFINFFPVGLDPYELLGNPNLLSEANHQMDILLGWKSEKMVLEANYFLSYLTNFISSEIRPEIQPRLPNAPGVRQFINIDNALMTGLELSYYQSLFENWQHRLSAAFTYGDDLVNQAPLPEIPPLEIDYVLSADLLAKKLKPELLIRRAFAQKRISELYGENTTPAFTVVDLSFSYRLMDQLELASGVQNLFDVSYYNHLTRSIRDANERPIFAPGRNFFVTINVDLMP